MKRISTLIFVLFLGLCSFAVLVQAQTSQAFRFDGALADGTLIEVVHTPENLKLGLIIKNAAGEQTSSYLFSNVVDLSAKFYRTSAGTFGAVDARRFVYFELSDLQAPTVSIRLDGGSERTLQAQEPVSLDSLRPFGGCRNYCYPSDPAQYNWWLCFWCCATTGRDPC